MAGYTVDQSSDGGGTDRLDGRKTGMTVRCELDTRLYPKGIKVSDEEMATLTRFIHTHSRNS